MAKTDSIHMRIDPTLKADVESTLNQLGLSTTDAINIFLRQVVLSHGIPFDVRLPKPNVETLAAMEEAKAISKFGKGFDNVKDLMRELNN